MPSLTEQTRPTILRGYMPRLVSHGIRHGSTLEDVPVSLLSLPQDTQDLICCAVQASSILRARSAGRFEQGAWAVYCAEGRAVFVPHLNRQVCTASLPSIWQCVLAD